MTFQALVLASVGMLTATCVLAFHAERCITSRDFSCVTFVVHVCRVVTCDCAS
jgi:hypothetical protein